VAEQRQFQAHAVAGLARVQPCVAGGGDNLGGDRSQAVEADVDLSRILARLVSVSSVVARLVGPTSSSYLRQGVALGAGALDEHAADHLVLGAPRQSRRAAQGLPTLRTTAFQRPRGFRIEGLQGYSRDWALYPCGTSALFSEEEYFVNY
jgi:hypothetical protein